MLRLPLGFTLLALAGCVTNPTPEPDGTAAVEQAIASQTLRAMFYTLDCTDEGHLEAGEIAEHMAQLFRPYDVDRSITLSAKEFSRAGRLSDPALQAEAFKMSDADRNGQVTSQEFAAYLTRLMSVVDADRDGEITPMELGDGRLAR